MKVVLDLLFIIAIGYCTYKVIELLLKMKQGIILPTTLEETQNIRKDPQRTIQPPNYSNHKVGIIFYFLMLLFVIVMFILGTTINEGTNWTYYLLLFLPLSHSYNLFNMFAIVEDGLLYGSRFIAWKKIKSFEFVRIDGRTHKYYGHSKEVNNNGYELRMKRGFSTISIIVTSEEMKERLTQVINKYVAVSDDVQEGKAISMDEKGK